jgi:uncharacterized protein (TIGR00369 family)|tara:strand:- start:89018 stop:89458 length:441 start_codon:yes stop_codon:yes gene_type:complete
MSFEDLATLLAESEEGPLTCLPYAQLLGLHYVIADATGVTVTMPFQKTLIGAPKPPRLHGGTVAGLMEIASIAQLVHELRQETTRPGIKPINVTVDYLRAGQPEATHARARIVRQGRRIAHINVEAWQSDPAQPIAGGRMNALLTR